MQEWKEGGFFKEGVFVREVNKVNTTGVGGPWTAALFQYTSVSHPPRFFFSLNLLPFSSQSKQATFYPSARVDFELFIDDDDE
jgi:hypothetical protein